MEAIHIYKAGVRGRSLHLDLRTRVRSGRVTCSECPEVGSINYTSLPPPEMLDKKLVQKGWELDPNICPSCVAKRKKAKTVAKKEQVKMKTNTMTKPVGTLSDNPVLKTVSSDAHKATAKMHQLLVLNFDTDEGRYAEGWDDERVAKESGLSPTHVTEVRNIAYGELKEPEEIAALRKDIKALNDLIGETLVAAQKEVNALNKRVAEICTKLGVKL